MNRVAQLAAAAIESQRNAIDAGLTTAAGWRGPLRRELRGRAAPEARARVRETFNALRQTAASGGVLDVGALCRIHDAACGGGAFRTGNIRVGRDRTFPSPRHVPARVDDALGRAAGSSDPAAAVATRLHLDLLLIHPFRDGNGRTARLAHAWVLLKAGYRSTLLTAAEQHFAGAPWLYIAAFRKLRVSREIETEEWTATALQVAAEHSRWAARIAAREQRLLGGCEQAGVPVTLRDREMIRFDFCRGGGGALTAYMRDREPPWYEVSRQLSPRELDRLRWQVDRLRHERVAETFGCGAPWARYLWMF